MDGHVFQACLAPQFHLDPGLVSWPPASVSEKEVDYLAGRSCVGPRAEDLEGGLSGSALRVQEQNILEGGRENSGLCTSRIGKRLVSKKEYQLPSTIRYRQTIVALEFYNLELITALA